MNPSFARILCGAALAVAVTSGPAVAQTAEPSEEPTHLPMKPHRNADGSLKHGFRGTVTTQSWAGYAVTIGRTAAIVGDLAGTERHLRWRPYALWLRIC